MMKMNMDLLSRVALFVGGALIGSAVTYKLVKTKYEKITKEELQSIRESYSMSVDEDRHAEEETKKEEKKKEKSNRICRNIIRESGYSGRETEEDEEDEDNYENEYGDSYWSDGEEEEGVYIAPYIILPEEFGDRDYAEITLDYFEGDDTLVNDRGKIISNPEDIVGTSFKTRFGVYEKDTVYVRDENSKIDYEILRDHRAYTEVY